MPARSQRRKAPDGGVTYDTILRNLNTAYDASVTAELALKHQNVERDSAIAATLRRSVIWPISETLIAVRRLAGVGNE